MTVSWLILIVPGKTISRVYRYGCIVSRQIRIQTLRKQGYRATAIVARKCASETGIGDSRFSRCNLGTEIATLQREGIETDNGKIPAQHNCRITYTLCLKKTAHL